jgi:hypothetical protein
MNELNDIVSVGYENAIARVKAFIIELTFVQDVYFKGLITELGLTDEGKDLLFDYIFNETEEKFFTEYLKKHGKSFGELK